MNGATKIQISPEGRGKVYPLELALKTAKTFTVSRTKKYDNVFNPSLRGAYVTEQYVYTTNNETLIRIEHDGDVKEPYVHMYSASDTANYKNNPRTYPDVNRIIPDRYNASLCYEIADMGEWQQIQEMAAVVKNKNTLTTLNLDLDRITAKNFDTELALEFTYRHLPLLRNIEYRMPKGDDAPTIHYSAKYMIKICKAFKQLKHDGHIHLYIYGAERPMLLEGAGITALQLPLREQIKVPEKYQSKKMKAHA